ncbi:MAG: WYL domain-containing protein [Actinomycetota bacterium]|nr:WYL domain-containing protein [Actinomycetota bacterium]
MNRTDRLYALVEELRAAGPRGRSARRLAEHFEVSVRTIERDLSALGQAGVPLTAQPGRRGGYVVDRAMTLPPLNFTPGEAAAVAVALSASERVPWAGEARGALRKIVAAMPEGAVQQARELAEGVRLLVQPTAEPDPEVAGEVWRAVYEGRRLLLDYTDIGGERTVREVDPHHVVLGPNGQYLTGWCHLRQDDRVFRMDRITAARPAPGPRVLRTTIREPAVPDLVTLVPAWE